MSKPFAIEREQVSGSVVRFRREPRRPESPRMLALLAVSGWTAAALGVYAIELGSSGPLSGLSSAQCTLAKIAFVFTMGAVFGCVARRTSLEMALRTGLAWLVFSIAADLLTSLQSARDTYRLLGDPIAPQLLRDLMMLAWVAGPSVFARRVALDGHSEGFR
jgi:hypothetical protein